MIGTAMNRLVAATSSENQHPHLARMAPIICAPAPLLDAACHAVATLVCRHTADGTAWKKERTVELVIAAVRSGFRAIDTACQPKHYREDLVGEALTRLAEEANARSCAHCTCTACTLHAHCTGSPRAHCTRCTHTAYTLHAHCMHTACTPQGVARDELWIQTKFCPYAGQDPDNLPYAWPAPLEQQVAESVATSLANLRTSYLDCLLLHSPLPTHAETMRVWRAMEARVASGEVRTLGVSNFYDEALFGRLCDEATVKPSVLQNRFYAVFGYDVGLREACAARGMRYQSFWTLTGNPDKLGAAPVVRAAAAHACTVETVWLSFAVALGVTPLTGTTSDAHMREGQAAAELRLSAGEVDEMRQLIWRDWLVLKPGAGACP